MKAVYNAASHAIESPAGLLLATLTQHVPTQQAWDIADSWGLSEEAIQENITEERAAAAAEIEELKSEIRITRAEARKACESLGRAHMEIAELKQHLTGEGAVA
jgi:predicted transcriptional regulator